MSFTVKRKQLVLAGLVVALSTAMYVNWYYTKPAAENGKEISLESTTQQSQQVNLGDAQYVNAGVTGEFFAEAQLKRSQAQDEAKQTLNAVIQDEKADAESKKAAQESLDNLAEKIVLQSEIESLIKAKSGGDVFVTLGASAEIILSSGTLTNELSIQIMDIITNKTEISPDKITIIEVK